MSIDNPDQDPGAAPADQRDTVPETPDAKRDALPPVEARIPDPETDARRAKQQPLITAIMEDNGVSTEVQLELVASYDAEAVKSAAEDVAFVAQDYGIDGADLDQATRDKLAVMYLGIKDARNEGLRQEVAKTMERELQDALVRVAHGKIDRLTEDLRRNLDAPDLQDRLRAVMTTVGRVGENFPVDEEHEEEWRELTDKFRGLVSLREGSEQPVQEAFEKVFQENESVVEDGFAAAYMLRKGGDVEKNLMGLYGRSREEQEKIKVRNRAEAAAVIEGLADKPLDFAALESLHRANNRNIVPRDVSKIRAEGSPPTFKERIGLMPDDLKIELDKTLAEADRLRGMEIGDGPGQISKDEYARRAAQLHNDVLDMHPFSDRNGSTALLFLETLMTKVGYKPPTERKKEFVENVRDILGGDEAAMTVLWQGQMKMNEPGYFVGESNKSEEKRKWYDRFINIHRAMAGKAPYRRPGAKEDED
ncbi:MAG TPA: hypothetical protein VL500_04460 [Candidatus Eisenbacteria bacterium]|nr:hypothetical protein [Candidatus Eisenbacteria bacterium]